MQLVAVQCSHPTHPPPPPFTADHLAFVFDTLQEDLVNDYVRNCCICACLFVSVCACVCPSVHAFHLNLCLSVCAPLSAPVMCCVPLMLQVKQLFLEYGGVSIVLPFIRPGKVGAISVKPAN